MPTNLTLDRPANPIDQPAGPALLIPDVEAARLAGVSRAHWHRLRAAGKVPPAVKLGRAIRWRRSEIAEWVGAGCPDSATWNAMRAAADRRAK